MIYCVWYPSGGFGHFVNAILSLHGKKFKRPKKTMIFGDNGNSHDLDLIAPKYWNDQSVYCYEFLDDLNYSVLIDNGNKNESKEFQQFFPSATMIKMCYDDWSWPIVARTLIEKVLLTSIEKILTTDEWCTDAPWARREKYFLFLRDNELRYQYRASESHNINVKELSNYQTLFEKLNSIVSVEPFEQLWNDWQVVNSKFFYPIQTAEDVINAVENKVNIDISHIQDLWTQAVVYYYIWLQYNIEVPHNDFENFFKDTQQIINLV